MCFNFTLQKDALNLSVPCLLLAPNQGLILPVQGYQRGDLEFGNQAVMC